MHSLLFLLVPYAKENNNMPTSIIYLIILSAFLGLAAWLIFLWAVKKGQMDDIEAPKYRMLDDDVPPPPAKSDPEKKSDA